MNSLPSLHLPLTSHRTSPSSCCVPDDLEQHLTSARNILEQPPPPTLCDILAAYRARGDGDRDMLFAMLNAKTAEDQRLASIASLQRSVLEMSRASSPHPEHHHLPLPQPPTEHYPVQPCIPSSCFCDRQAQRPHHHQHHNRPPLPTRYHRDRQPASNVPTSHLPRKRRRSSSYLSPLHYHESHFGSSREQLPPSPYSARSDSFECSPRSRPQMTIGSLLTRPTRKGDGGDVTS